MYVACKDGPMLNETQYHRHPTRSKGQLENNTMQLEQKQMKEYLPDSFNFSDMSTSSPPNQLECNKLIQGKYK